ncbi:acyl-phosphate glycerol 3-phosphate acyltransferase [candidate division WOR-3 bacterium]|uniref:Glycerol-3-phosphate acyltransferase n=1 Tax=candidate division WOR-3 bacterium TaxID=2052148 RepID=A0A660SFE1_UNCW3|nr:MAG: acyl-phosphate glycerol 3-phosphate acyltransferase [candidate division WOR-3 bacterium]
MGPLIAFLLGSIPTGFLIGRVHGVDIRKLGSGNIGATNVHRILGKRWGEITFLLDLLKGLIPMIIFLNPWLIPCSVLGHCFSPWLHFRGGKGVSTLIGATMIIYPFGTLVSLLIWYLIQKCFGYVSLASIILAISLPVVTGLSYQIMPLPLIIAGMVVVIRHSTNIRKLLSGSEPKTDFLR